jgi:hypothetical protein
MPVPMLHETGMPVVPRSWSQRSIGSEIHILTDRSNRTSIENCAVSKVSATANRGWLRECEGICQNERSRKNDCFRFHFSLPPIVRKRTKTVDVGCKEANALPPPTAIALPTRGR